jgi:hypothetical protein
VARRWRSGETRGKCGRHLSAYPVRPERFRDGHLDRLSRNRNFRRAICCSFAAAAGFGVLIYLTSVAFAELAAAAFAMIATFRYLLTTSTSAGMKTISELAGFREFLARTDSDKLNRENVPDKTPENFEPYSAYAVALKAEHGWGEEFAAILAKLIELDDAYSWKISAVPAMRGSRRSHEDFGGDVIAMNLWELRKRMRRK